MSTFQILGWLSPKQHKNGSPLLQLLNK